MRYIFLILFVAVFGFFQYAIMKKPHTRATSIVSATGSFGILKLAEKEIMIDSVRVSPGEYVAYAKTLIGTPYLYASCDPNSGFDCSGFVTYVSNHFGIKVPRSSVDFINFGTTIKKKNSRPGDLILFTGTDTSSHVVGHIGIITDNKDGRIQFIHSSSGKANGVTISDLSGYYDTRFIKVIRIME